MSGALAQEGSDPIVRLQRFEAALENMSHGVCFFDGEQRLILSNRRYAELYDLAPEDLTPGITLREVIELRFRAGSGPRMSADDYHSWRNSVATRNDPHESMVEMANGRSVIIKHQPMPDGGWVATHEDITEQRRSAAQIVQLAHYDALTGVANRVLFRSRLNDAFDRLARREGFAVLCIDLDRFKEVNDTLGHPVGDLLLQAATQRLLAKLRDCDTLARLGGDEFAIVQDRVATAREAAGLARRVLEALSAPFQLGEHQVLIGASVGVALAPADGRAADELLRNADTALYRAKSDGRGCTRFFESEMNLRMHVRRSLELDLFKALEAGEFELVFQPFVAVASRRATGLEALLRWRSPTRGLVLPDKFIPLAEETGLIVRIGEWVLREACGQAARLPPALKIAVNLSPVQLAKSDLAGTVATVLRETGLDPARLELEITETVMLQDTEATLASLHALRALGVGIAMDDFGTGYSSLSALQRFPFTKVKIDRAFVRGLGEATRSAAIVRAVAELSGVLGMTTTAEGVETEAQLATLARCGCTEAQGFLFSEGCPAGELPALLARLGPAVASVG